jgi:hypothetical protein
VFADEETRIYCVFDSVIPSVRQTVSFACIVESYTTQFAAAGVPADAIIPIRYRAAVEAVFVTTIDETTAVVAPPVL